VKHVWHRDRCTKTLVGTRRVREARVSACMLRLTGATEPSGHVWMCVEPRMAEIKADVESSKLDLPIGRATKVIG
jgi:hypothetical protein